MRKAFSLTFLFIILNSVVITNLLSHHDTTRLNHWLYSDVRALDPIDASEPGAEIVAVLTQKDSDIIKIRIDFLDLALEEKFDLIVYLDCQPGGNQVRGYPGLGWDYLIRYSGSGTIRIFSNQYIEINNFKLRILKDLRESYIVLAFGTNDLIIANNLALLPVVVSSETESILDQTDLVLIGGSPPPPVKIAFQFWNVISIQSPAMILRTWAGAHTGPQSSRHGFYYLLSASKSWNIPISVCDLYNYDILFTMKYLQVQSFVNKLISGYLLDDGVCDVYYGYAKDTDEVIASNDVLSDMTSFVATAINYHYTNGNSPMIIGGDLSRSVLGSPETAGSLFSFIASHPWIRVERTLDTLPNSIEIIGTPAKLLNNPDNIPNTITGAQFPSGLTNLEILYLIEAELAYMPQNNLSTLAKHTYQNVLLSNQANIRMAQGSYLSQIGHIIEAAQWAEHPEEKNTCFEDIDWDGQPECILASTNFYLTFELNGGYLAFAFVLTENGVHQVISPTTLFDGMRSDPSQLKIESGLAGDPGQILGAFTDLESSIQQYAGTFAEPYTLEMISRDGNTRKSFTLYDNSIGIVIIANGYNSANNFEVPIALDPWLIYSNSPEGLYWGYSRGDQWVWGAGDEIALGIRSGDDYSHYAFNSTYNMLLLPEDPNFNYTSGHLLPIPMALVIFQPNSSIDMEIMIDP